MNLDTTAVYSRPTYLLTLVTVLAVVTLAAIDTVVTVMTVVRVVTQKNFTKKLYQKHEKSIYILKPPIVKHLKNSNCDKSKTQIPFRYIYVYIFPLKL